MNDVAIVITAGTHEVESDTVVRLGELISERILPLIESYTEVELVADIVNDMSLLHFKKECEHEFLFHKKAVCCSKCSRVFPIIGTQEGSKVTLF